MGLRLIFIGFLFMLNPMLGVLDILPDFIGGILILLGLRRLSYVSPELNEAFGYMKWAVYISCARFLCVFTATNLDDIMHLSITLVFAVFEFAVMLFALPALSDGLSYLNIRYSGHTAEQADFRIVGLIFFAVRGFLSVVPQLGGLNSDIYNEGNLAGGMSSVDFGGYWELLTTVNVVITLAVAVVWLLSIWRYVGSIMRDSEMTAAIAEAYRKKQVSEPALFIRRRLQGAVLLFNLAFLCLIDFIGDGINYIPDFLFGILSLVGTQRFSPYCERGRRVYIAGGVYTAFAIASWAVSYTLEESHYYLSFATLLKGFFPHYLVTVILAAAEALALIWYLYTLTRWVMPIADQHIGLAVSEEFVRTISENRRNAAVLKRYLKAIAIVGSAVAVSGVAFIATLHGFAVYWMIHLAINIALVLVVVSFCSRLSAGIRERYEKPGEKDGV